MKLSPELVAEMANVSKRMKEFGGSENTMTIDSSGVLLSLDMFMSTFKTYTREELEGREKFFWYKTVVGGVLFSTIPTEAEVIAHIERSKRND